MPSLLRKVKTRLSIHAHRKVRGLLEGEYTSVFHGRSVEFDDLRHYVAGDALKDIDWKATARMGTPMTRRYIASRKHTVMLVTDTGRDMAALAAGGERKADIAILAAGVVGYLATRHGDLVGIIAGDSGQTRFRAPASSDAHLEGILQLMHVHTTLDSQPSDLAGQLGYLARSFRRRMILLVISDDRELGGEEVRLLRRLAVQHEILWLTIGDADPTGARLATAEVFEVADGRGLPAFLRGGPAIAREFAAEAAASVSRRTDVLEGLEITSRRVGSESEVVPALFRLLDGHRRARR